MAMSFELRRGLEKELDHAGSCYQHQQWSLAFHHLERAHILSQRYPLWHARVHRYMLYVGWCQGSGREVFGQLLRSLAALLFSYVWVPEGNTGGTNVSAFKPMALPKDLGLLLDCE